ncbi:probable serine/threonine-protein kinase WNK4 [Chenopodium quinoa]|uniref:probable serine/threonine-protein kinase WNK4 n=1 Tax=Chenopodium quinoa TaxID=63459 RepID=UPI000B76BAB1|nr:probable serine/threonine-protein kinase WNK4 [Chenopodium quinoa]
MAASSSHGDDGTIRQYTKYDNTIEQGVSKVVYKGLDRVNNRVISWIKKNITEQNYDGLMDEAQDLMDSDHPSILKCYDSWVDPNSNTVDMITELYSCNLRDFIKNNRLILDTTALPTIKSWCRQILEGLHYLHQRNPAIILHSIRCENIVVGETGLVKIGDLCEAASMGWETPLTPDASADLFHISRSEIYYFGMTVLQMVTKEDVERRLVDSRVMPAELKRVKDQQLKKFIRRCLIPTSVVTTVTDLLNDPFLAPSDPIVSVPVDDERDVLLLPSAREIDRERESFTLGGQLMGRQMRGGGEVILGFVTVKNFRETFMYTVNHDTVQGVVEGLRQPLELSDVEAASISESIEQLIAKLVAEYDSNEGSNSNIVLIFDSVSSLRISSTERSVVYHQTGAPPIIMPHNQDAQQDQQQQQQQNQHGVPDDNNVAASDEEVQQNQDAQQDQQQQQQHGMPVFPDIDASDDVEEGMPVLPDINTSADEEGMSVLPNIDTSDDEEARLTANAMGLANQETLAR